MIRIEISLFLKNVPGELADLTALFGEADINIDAITIQDASAYVQKLFEARGKSLKRLASSASPKNSVRNRSISIMCMDPCPMPTANACLCSAPRMWHMPNPFSGTVPTNRRQDQRKSELSGSPTPPDPIVIKPPGGAV
ncbi:MAG: hypothetical protein LC660_01095 [Desulfobacteraceae bacterium]|nr:hypothetical protein [Desulfobacteraceae bacterium]